ncbi:B-cell lymphoma 3 protein isoform X2 [Protopterus annectens]|uniref:B-cell lymphoma 3 protein isoform X2 n=1 Tax=Protopterus annectens TaxID=7888 RepID=UPI001CFA3236|nr:B-cell lymphoma 3 protein isoform X2 [Protopterus annectens]
MGQELGFAPLDLTVNTHCKAGHRNKRERDLGIERRAVVVEHMVAGSGRAEDIEQHTVCAPKQLKPVCNDKALQAGKAAECGILSKVGPITKEPCYDYSQRLNSCEKKQTESRTSQNLCPSEGSIGGRLLPQPNREIDPCDGQQKSKEQGTPGLNDTLCPVKKMGSPSERNGSSPTATIGKVRRSPLCMVSAGIGTEEQTGLDVSSDQEQQDDSSARDTKEHPRDPHSLPLRKRRYIEPKEMHISSPKRENYNNPTENGPLHKIKKEDPTISAVLEQQHIPDGTTLVNGHPQVERPLAQYSRSLTQDSSWIPGYYAGIPTQYLTIPVYPAQTFPTFSYNPVQFPLSPGMGHHLASDCAKAIMQDEDGDTPLHIAVVQCNFLAVQKLITLFHIAQKELDIFNNLRQTPLHLSVITKQPSLTGVLLSNGASPMTSDRNGQTAIHLACEHHSTECLQKIMEHSSSCVDLEKTNFEGFSPLHVSVNSGNKEIVNLLLEHGARIDVVDSKSGRTPLIHAVEKDDLEMVNLLIEHSANVNLQTFSGNTALHSASGRGLLDIVRVLLKNGADTSIKNYHNDTPQMVAKNRKVTDILRGKASKSIQQQNLQLKIPEIRKDSSPPAASNCSSPSNMLTPTSFGCQSPNSGQHQSPLTSYLTLPGTSSPPRSSSNQSCDSRSSQGQRSPVMAVGEKARTSQEMMDSSRLINMRSTNGFSCHSSTAGALVPSHLLYSDTKLDRPPLHVAPPLQQLNYPIPDYPGGYYPHPFWYDGSNRLQMEHTGLTHQVPCTTSGRAFVPVHAENSSVPHPFIPVTSVKKPFSTSKDSDQRPLAHTHFAQLSHKDKPTGSSVRNNEHLQTSLESRKSRDKEEYPQ